MANPNFDPTISTNTIWRDTNEAQCLTDDLDTIEADIADLESGKASTAHTHDGYAAADHTHTGYAAADHTHSGYAAATHSHSEFAPTSHSHAQADVTGLASALTAKADLVDGKIPEAQLPSYVDDVVEYANLAAFPATGESGKVYVAQDTNKTYRWSGSAYVEISGGIVLGETSSTAYRGDRGKTAYEHSQNATVHVTADQKTAWDSKAAGDHTHTAYAAAEHSHSDYAAADHTHMVFTNNVSANTYKLIYVATDGNDDNTGFSQSVPMATVKGVIRKYAEKYKMLDIRLADGTYTEDIGAIGTDVPNISIRSVSENKDAVTINMATQIDLNCGLTRIYNMTINVTATGTRPISVNSGYLYAYNVRINVPSESTISCVNVYNGAQAFLMHCVLNSGTASNSGAAVYGNQAGMIKAINCTSERTVALGFHAHNGTDISYTNTITATTVAKETYYGKCTVR